MSSINSFLKYTTTLKIFLFSSLIGISTCTPLNETTDPSRETLEQAVENNNMEDLLANALKRAQSTVPQISLAQIGAQLRPHDIIYRPDGEGPFPAVLFFHGCSGRTLSHEQDWAKRYNSAGVALISVDSYSGRGIDWEDACNMEKMLPWQRAGDVLSTIEYAKSLTDINPDQLYLSGFSHGAMTVWATLVFASSKTPPIGLDNWSVGGIEGVKAAFPFYGSCREPWTVDVDTTIFLGDSDRYIDESACEDYLPLHPKGAGPLTVTIYKEATHTFDHAVPNEANVAAGSVYDAKATAASWQRILTVMGKFK